MLNIKVKISKRLKTCRTNKRFSSFHRAHEAFAARGGRGVVPMGKGKKGVRRVRSKVDLGKLERGLISRLKNIISGAGDKRNNSQAGDGR